MLRKMLLPCVIVLTSGCATQPMQIPDMGSPEAKLFASRCGTCHALPHPERNTATEWTGILTLMEERMKERGAPPLSEQELETLTKYLQTHAR